MEVDIEEAVPIEQPSTLNNLSNLLEALFENAGHKQRKYA